MLVAIAVGGAGAAIYLALDVAEKSATKSEIRQLQTQASQASGGALGGGDLESRASAAATAAGEARSEIAKLKLEVKALQTEVKAQSTAPSKK